MLFPRAPFSVASGYEFSGQAFASEERGGQLGRQGGSGNSGVRLFKGKDSGVKPLLHAAARLGELCGL